MTTPAAIDVQNVSFRYPQRQALCNLSLQVREGEVFALLGPNGGGKTTLFRLLSTLIPLQQGEIDILGRGVRRQAADVRRSIGVVFQAPSVDKKLTVAENLHHQGMLYGLSGTTLAERRDEMLSRLGLTDRAGDRVETLSGGLRRRVELAKGLLHRPRVLLMDEPSAGLDPAARADLWEYLRGVARGQGVTVVLTTHLLEEADRADRLAILHEGRLVALDITIESDQGANLAEAISQRFQCRPTVVDGSVRIRQPGGRELIGQLLEAFPEEIRSISLGKPTLEDVFIDRTGHRFWRADREAS